MPLMEISRPVPLKRAYAGSYGSYSRSQKRSKYNYRSRKSRAYNNVYFRPQRLLRTGFPKSTTVKLKYVDYCSLNPSIGAYTYHAFSANSLYDPNRTSTGHQPMGFDQWSAFYNHYVVISSKITFKVFYSSGSTDNGQVVGVFLNDDVTGPASISDIMEQPLSKYVSGQSTYNVNSNMPLTAYNSFSAKRFFNVDRVADNTRNIGAVVTANPSDEAFFLCFFGTTPGAGADLPASHCTVEIEYLAMFSEPKDLPSS